MVIWFFPKPILTQRERPTRMIIHLDMVQNYHSKRPELHQFGPPPAPVQAPIIHIEVFILEGDTCFKPIFLKFGPLTS
jgi:hypothetical protein